MAELTHIDEKGNAHMVDVSEKRSTVRTAIATGSITMNRQCYNAVKNGGQQRVLPALWPPSERMN